ncbi:probable mediator of RNA polymerase II transcription subunit 26c isoform X1 [Lycium ferocissimum]|uniref:probable mediator of RNA polymerase II transcription subunit 26c isoform X1 n=1 Tax=Lycium ferocissimum TaxID=112874 RepID=UPI0028158835|nr:probable mediator of RNA polymerase II transcription subunit 26c isoform X1 [Lycium ferocissimum]
MELDELRSILNNSSVDLWDLIDTAISVAILDHGKELRSRRDGIVEKLYNCNSDGNYEIPQSLIYNRSTESNIDDYKLKREEKSVEYEDLESKILIIKNHFEIPNQSDNCLVDLLQSLAEMDISFKVLEKTDIGRHVNRVRKHSSNEVRRLVKLLIRRWKDIVDEWVRLNTPVEETGDADSPFQPHLNNFQDDLKERESLYGNISNGSSSYCGHKQSVEKNNISPSSKRLREDYLEESHGMFFFSFHNRRLSLFSYYIIFVIL